MLGVRLEPDLARKLAAIAKRQGRSKSDVAREAIRRYLESTELVREARRQSLRVSCTAGERDALELISQITAGLDEP